MTKSQKKYKKNNSFVTDIPSRQKILNELSRHKKRFWNWVQIFRALKLNKNQLDGVKKRVLAMVRDRQLLAKKETFCYVSPIAHVTGRVVVKRYGDAYIHTDSDIFPRIELRAFQCFDLLPDDTVEVSITHQERGAYRGVIMSQIKRQITFIQGFYDQDAYGHCLVPLDKRLPNRISLEKPKKSVQHGELIAAKITQYPHKRLRMSAQLHEIIGGFDQTRVEHRLVMQQFNWSDSWSKDIEKELKGLSQPQSIPEDRIDWTDKAFVTIDGCDARDYDDAVYVSKVDNGWMLHVAIADVSHYVSIGSALDKEAMNRATSVYLPGKMIPMLPETLSCDLCSLKEKVLRYAMGISLHISLKGEISRVFLGPVVIQVRQRLTYKAVNAMLQGSQNIPNFWQDVLPQMTSVYEKLAENRKKRFALDFDGQETRMRFNDHGKIIGFYSATRGLAERYIEEMMIVANEQVALFLSQHEVPSLYRVHEAPEAQKIASLNQFLQAYQLPLVTDNLSSYCDLINHLKNTNNGRVYQQMVLRSLKQAHYDTENLGHFGLGLDHYLHFTSPIRRYPDLCVHRAIRHIYDKKQSALRLYPGIAQHCSIQERQAEEGSRQVENWLKCQYLEERINQVMTGVIVTVLPFGFFVSLDNINIEGLVHVSRLPLDRYAYDPDLMMLSGQDHGLTYRLGDQISIRIASVSMHNQQIDFDLDS
ncbi:MAG: ribonuclease R [Candidatus Comchoanobacterales bacterium]